MKSSANLEYFTVEEKETFLIIGMDQESYSESFISFCYDSVVRSRSAIEKYIRAHPQFKTSFRPLAIAPDAPQIVRRMGKAAQAADVGPMAAVAGAVAEALGEEISPYCREIIIENGGDIYLKSSQKRIIGIFAGESKFSYQLGLEIAGNQTPLGLCTSSGTTGPSISLGKADAVVIKAACASLADAVATATANRIQTAADLKPALEYANKISGVTGVLAMKDKFLAAWGGIKLVKL